VTGPKVDRWLVKTVGVLVTVIGAVLLLAGRGRRAAQPEPAVLATGSATALATIDTVYALRGRIAKVYLLDAVLEVALVAAWVAALLRDSGSARRRSSGARTTRRPRAVRAATGAGWGS
jgi:hypothetical protein